MMFLGIHDPQKKSVIVFWTSFPEPSSDVSVAYRLILDCDCIVIEYKFNIDNKYNEVSTQDGDDQIPRLRRRFHP